MNNTFLYRDRNWLFEQMIIFGKTEKQLSQEFGWTKRVIEKWVQIYGFGDNNFKNLKTVWNVGIIYLENLFKIRNFFIYVKNRVYLWF